MDITSLSSRGQIVIPQEVRDRLHLQEGEKFMVIGEGDTVILKKMQIPAIEDFDNLLKRTREFAKKKGIKEKDVQEAIQRVRRK